MDATPAVKGTVPPGKKVTVPVGVPDTPEGALTVAVIVIVWPGADGFAELERVTVGVGSPTLKATGLVEPLRVVTKTFAWPVGASDAISKTANVLRAAIAPALETVIPGLLVETV